MYWLMFSTYFATFFDCSSGTIDCWAPWQQLHSQPPEYGHRQAFIWIDGKKWELWIRWLCCDGAPDWIWEAQWTWRPARHGIGEILLLENSLSCADEVLQVEVYIPVFKKLFFSCYIKSGYNLITLKYFLSSLGPPKLIRWSQILFGPPTMVVNNEDWGCI